MAAEGQRAVIDRIVDGVAVLLVGEDQTEQHVPAEQLPDGARAGDWLQLDTDGTTTVDDGHTAQRRRALARRRERIRRGQAGGRF